MSKYVELSKILLLIERERKQIVNLNSKSTPEQTQKRLSYLQASADACGVEIRRLGHEAHCLAVEIGIADLRGPDHYRPTTASAGFGRDFNLERRAPEPKK